ncbi:hypothetical protein ROHU_002236 [Labeo rohita]|uniref:Uncharacterized protein n=1 Tax=Labeo rohita TaxID=84645 RepID=A0A498P0X8_LABRO|nr:hypothetical protein ROHU_002236 [Labeo rohita]
MIDSLRRVLRLQHYEHYKLSTAQYPVVSLQDFVKMPRKGRRSQAQKLRWTKVDLTGWTSISEEEMRDYMDKGTRQMLQKKKKDYMTRRYKTDVLFQKEKKDYMKEYHDQEVPD